MKILLLASIALLAASLPVHARGGRGGGRGFVGGRGARSSGVAARGAASRGSFTRAAGAAITSRRAATTAGRVTYGRGATSGGTRTYFPGTLRKDAGGSGTGTSTQDAPPNFTKPGALIRTEGQLPVYSDPGPTRTHSVEGGGFIAQDAAISHDAARSPGVTFGRPDTAPSTGGAGGSGVTSNGGSFDPSF